MARMEKKCPISSWSRTFVGAVAIFTIFFSIIPWVQIRRSSIWYKALNSLNNDFKGTVDPGLRTTVLPSIAVLSKVKRQ